MNALSAAPPSFFQGGRERIGPLEPHDVVNFEDERALLGNVNGVMASVRA